ncbi:hypothetical protein G5I_04843 [Acromyrmex echinatior]|uniref:Uncharacterized protein n=1 Tax=Acromyrmex echinatior TaxID=103372 RepID=F4WGQ1_ACREC|nr:hypothetical protein G5I_04843 [Acromyrmex echinatior]
MDLEWAIDFDESKFYWNYVTSMGIGRALGLVKSNAWAASTATILQAVLQEVRQLRKEQQQEDLRRRCDSVETQITQQRRRNSLRCYGSRRYGDGTQRSRNSKADSPQTS